MLRIKLLPYIILTGQAILTIAAVTLLNNRSDVKIQVILAGVVLYIIGIVTVNSNFNQNENLSLGHRFLYILRLTKHEFQNHLQILFSMIQLKKYQDALKYIEDVVNSSRTINHIYSSSTDPMVICGLLELIYTFRQKDINVKVEVLDEDLRWPLLPDFAREMEKYISQFDKIPGNNKDIKIILRNTKIEVLSDALDKKDTFKIRQFNG